MGSDNCGNCRFGYGKRISYINDRDYVTIISCRRYALRSNSDEPPRHVAVFWCGDYERGEEVGE